MQLFSDLAYLLFCCGCILEYGRCRVIRIHDQPANCTLLYARTEYNACPRSCSSFPIWPIYFFVAVAFWNMVGAGLFGFMINPPIALYYMQGLNTTPVHAHAALFGVYGMLGIGLMLFCLRAIRPDITWNEKPLRFSFWAINFGLFAMVIFSLLPVGLMQTWASVKYGYWYARSSDFLQTPVMETLRWIRAFGDTIFAVGAIVLVYFVFKLSIKFIKE